MPLSNLRNWDFELRVLATFLLLMLAVVAIMGCTMACNSDPAIMPSWVISTTFSICLVLVILAVCVIPEIWAAPIRSDAKTVNSPNINDVPVSWDH